MEPEQKDSVSRNELVIAALPGGNTRLICLEFPGVVENESAAIARLGENDVLSKAHFEGHRLEVRFRPQDQYCSPALSKTCLGSTLILKIKRRKVVLLRDGSAEKSDEELEESNSKVRGPQCEYSAKLMGICNKTYQFLGMADYQVLPPGLNSQQVLVDPKDFQLNEPLDMGFCDRELPSFLPPSYFSKFDRPVDNYGFRPQLKTSSAEEGSTGRCKPRKYNLAHSISFNSTGVPKEPNPDAVAYINPNNPFVAVIRELFDERPIWSSAELQWRTKKSPVRIRYVLPLIAYHFTSGPFKRLWVKLGCDPRKDPSYKIYQSLDVRVSKEIKESHIPSCVEGPSSLELSDAAAAYLAEETVEETSFIFFPDRLPTQRQLSYQLCDIRDSEAQKLVHCNDGQETECTESNGWCRVNTYEKLRKLITSKVKMLAQKMDPSRMI